MKKQILQLCLGLGSGLILSFNALAYSENETQQKYGTLISSINEVLLDRFVFPEVAPKYAARLNECLKNDCLANAKDDKEVAKQLTEMLLAVHHDKHLNVFPPGHREKMRKRRMMKKKGVDGKHADNTGIAEVKILEDNIGYLKIDLFPGTAESVAATNEAMQKLKDTDAIIFDIRRHRGGSPRNITEISNFLFQQPTHMVTTRSPHVNDGKPSPHMSEPNEFAASYKGKPAYVLTSKRSGSAAEHFAMSMKSTGRAILVGETTGGYGHWGDVVKFDDGFSVFVPSGRTYHPVSELGWEAIGITPDIMVDAEESLEYSLKRIRALL